NGLIPLVLLIKIIMHTPSLQWIKMETSSFLVYFFKKEFLMTTPSLLQELLFSLPSLMEKMEKFFGRKNSIPVIILILFLLMPLLVILMETFISHACTKISIFPLMDLF